MLSMVRTSAKRRRPQRPEFADTTVWEVAHFERRLSTGHANVVITSLRKCTRGGVIVINSPLNLVICLQALSALCRPPALPSASSTIIGFSHTSTPSSIF